MFRTSKTGKGLLWAAAAATSVLLLAGCSNAPKAPENEIAVGEYPDYYPSDYSKLVDKAKGLLMQKQELTEPEAFRWIQRTAMDRRVTMKAVAQVVVETLG